MSGLFDIGFAGSASAAASIVVKAPALDPFSASTDDQLGLLADFEPGMVLNSADPFYHHTLSSVDTSANQNKIDLFEKPGAALVSSDVSTAEWGDLGDPLADLETDPLGDESLDAFVNLDQLLTGDAFLDDITEVKPVINMTPHTEEPVSVISIPSPAGGDNTDLDFFDFLDCCVPEVIPVFQNPSPSFPVASTSASFQVEPTSSGTTTKGASRKRKATPKAAPRPVKTSMFEIPMPISENVVSTTTAAIYTSPCSPELDHDYTSKSKITAEMSAAEVICQEGIVKGKGKEVVDKQSIRRQKNNIASKRSREQRKQKFSDLDREAEELVERNAALRLKIVELERVAREMKAALVAKMAGK
ncbi:hypothetical protein EGW08_007555 [Elysia chlorotica]|uniref:BZIP domain-containing protein n=1 Tax=Elysia chlorotica TaxID=188477 RepID=A0A3S0ZWF6_ELYCH|nr:hypothetical protein EGW08_007555 [Elysia chlorotica]